MNLNAAQLPFVQRVDGRRTIREIAPAWRRVGRGEVMWLTSRNSAGNYFSRCGVSIFSR